MPSPSEYINFLTKELLSKSTLIRDWYATHNPSAGENREDFLADIIRNFLPKKFEITNGLVLFADGNFSSQSDILIVDVINNRPLISFQNPIWQCESVYCLVEVKTKLNSKELKDGINKCRKFKRPKRHFSDENVLSSDVSLFALVAYDSISINTIKKMFLELLESCPSAELPDFIVVPSKFIIVSGQYRALSKFGAPGSPYRESNPLTGFGDVDRSYVIYEGENSLLGFLVWVDSFVKRAGNRSPNLSAYFAGNFDSEVEGFIPGGSESHWS